MAREPEISEMLNSIGFVMEGGTKNIPKKTFKSNLVPSDLGIVPSSEVSGNLGLEEYPRYFSIWGFPYPTFQYPHMSISLGLK